MERSNCLSLTDSLTHNEMFSFPCKNNHATFKTGFTVDFPPLCSYSSNLQTWGFRVTISITLTICLYYYVYMYVSCIDSVVSKLFCGECDYHLLIVNLILHYLLIYLTTRILLMFILSAVIYHCDKGCRTLFSKYSGKNLKN